MTLPAALKASLEATLGQIADTSLVGGGDISNAAKVSLSDGLQILVKWRSGPPSGIFTAERRGLELLRSAGALRVPEVFAQSEALDGCPGFIAMEWLDRGKSDAKVAGALGRGLAALHRVTAPEYGLDHDNFIGASPQPNMFDETWPHFYQAHRLGFQMELAAKKGRLPTTRARLLSKLITRLGDWLPTIPAASLLHGDLWGGNWLTTASGEPALIDPAVYYGHREADLAFTELFGGFSKDFYSAYNDAWPLDEGYRERKDLYNLYHLLNHLNLFGEGYGSGVDSILQRYVG